MRRSRTVSRSQGWALTLGLTVTLLIAASAGAAPVPRAVDSPVVTVRSPMTGQRVQAYDRWILVVPRPGVSAAQMAALNQQMGVVYARPLAHGKVWSLKLPATISMVDGMAQYLRSPLVKSAGPNGRMVAYGQPTRALRLPLDVPKAVPNDPYWDQQWGPQAIHCAQAWEGEKGDPNLAIAVLDTGVDYTHVDLTNHSWTNSGEIPGDGIDNDGNGYIDDTKGWDFVDNDNVPLPDMSTGDETQGHGTHVSGTASADTDNGIGVAGVAWNGKIMAVRVLGLSGGSTDGIIAGIQYAVDNGARVINMSLGPQFPYYEPAMQPPIDDAYSRGVVVVCAAGNSGEYSWGEITTDPSTWYSPVCNDGADPATQNHVLGVMATDVYDMKASFSNYGDAYHMLDVCAPGVDIWSTVPGNAYAGPPVWSGTSMAAPHVAGLAALVIHHMGTMDAGAVIDQIRNTADNIDSQNPGFEGKIGTGRINAERGIGFDSPPGPASAVNAYDTPGDEGGSITVTWRRSPDDGAGSNDVIGYEVWRGSTKDPLTGDFALVPGGQVPPKTSSFPDTSVTNGTNYYYYIVTKDKSNSVISSNVAGPAAARDDLAPPAVDTLTARDTPADQGGSISLSWAGYMGAADVAYFNIYRAEAEFSDVSDPAGQGILKFSWATGDPTVDAARRSFADDGNTQGAFPKPVDQTEYWYAVTAVDEVGNEIKAVTSVGPVKSGPNLNMAFGSGLRMITLPALPVDPSPLAVFNLTDPTQIAFARWDPATLAYHTLDLLPDDPFLLFAPGAGFWLNRTVPSYITGGGTPVTDATYDVAIGQGWNMVGSPYDADHPFVDLDVKDSLGTVEDITASNNVRKYAWRYDADASPPTYRLISPILPGGQTSLPKREAMWVYAYAPGLKLVFHNLVSAATAQTPAKVSLGGWQVRLVAQTATAADTDNFIGVTSQAASIGKIASPPLMSGGVDLFLTSGRRGADRLAVDLRGSVGAKATWDAAVQCATPKTTVRLSWPDLSSVPHDLRPMLTDLTTGRSVYMRTTAGYVYESGAASETRRFRLRFETGGAALVVTQLAATPRKAGGAELLYTLSRGPAQVQVEILNLAGRPIAAVGPTDGQAGLNRTRWNGLSSGGQHAPAGRYLVRVTATADDTGETTNALVPLTLGN